MNTNVLKVGMREFRAHLPEYLTTYSPIAITRHGETVGFYIPTRHHPKKTELEALKKAVVQLEQLLLSEGVNEDVLLSEYRTLRAKKTTPKKVVQKKR